MVVKSEDLGKLSGTNEKISPAGKSEGVGLPCDASSIKLTRRMRFTYTKDRYVHNTVAHCFRDQEVHHFDSKAPDPLSTSFLR